MNNTNELIVRTKEYHLEPETQQSLLQIFTPFFERAEEWKQKAGSIVVTDASQTREMQMARQARLALRDIRIDVEHERKRLKEYSLRKGKAIDGIANVIKFLIEPIEEHLEKQEKFVETQEENRKLLRLDDRMKLMQPFNLDLAQYNLKEMSDEDFKNLYKGTKLAIEQRIAKEKAEAEERERIRIENEKLKKEAEERERQMALERKQAEEKQKAIEEKARKERVEAEAKEKALEEKAREERELQEAELKKEREERERIEAELRAKEKAEKDAILKAEAERKRAMKAPDKQKLLAYLEALRNIPLPAISEDESEILPNINCMLGRLITYIKQEADKL